MHGISGVSVGKGAHVQIRKTRCYQSGVLVMPPAYTLSVNQSDIYQSC